MIKDSIFFTLRRSTIVAGVFAACAAGPTLAATAGTPIGGEFQVNTYTTGDQETPAVAMDANGNYVVVWDSVGEDGSLDGIFAQRYGTGGIPLGGEFQINTFVPNRQGLPVVAMLQNGNFVVAWNSQDESPVGQISVYARVFNADGTPLTGEIKVNDDNEYPRSGLSIASNANGEFVIGWVEQKPNSSISVMLHDMIVRTYSANGTPMRSSATVTTTINANMRCGTVGIANDGTIAAAWLEYNNSLYAKHLTANATWWGDVTRLDTANSAITGVDRPAIAMEGNGNFTVVWETFHSDLSPAGIHMRRFNESIKAQSSDVVVGTNMQYNPAIGMDANGDFVVAGHGNGIFAEIFASNGSAVGPEFQVNSSLDQNTQLFAATAMSSTGSNFVVAWQNFQQDGDGRGVFAQLYDGP